MTNGENQQSTSTQPTGQPQQPFQPYAPRPSPSGKAIATLILGILSLICCGFFCGIPAIIIGRQELKDIKEGRSNPEGNTIAQVGFILGIVGTVLSCLGALVYGLLLILGISAGVMESFQESAFNL